MAAATRRARASGAGVPPTRAPIVAASQPRMRARDVLIVVIQLSRAPRVAVVGHGREVRQRVAAPSSVSGVATLRTYGSLLGKQGTTLKMCQGDTPERLQ